MGNPVCVADRLGASQVAGVMACSVAIGTVKAVERRAAVEKDDDWLAEADAAKLVGERRERAVGAVGVL